VVVLNMLTSIDYCFCGTVLQLIGIRMLTKSRVFY